MGAGYYSDLIKENGITFGGGNSERVRAFAPSPESGRYAVLK